MFLYGDYFDEQIIAKPYSSPKEHMDEWMMENYEDISLLDKQADNLSDAEGILYTAFLNAINSPGMKLVIESAFNMPENGYNSFEGETAEDKISRLILDRWFSYAYEVIRSIRGEQKFNETWRTSMRGRIRSGDAFADMLEAVKAAHNSFAEAA